MTREENDKLTEYLAKLPNRIHRNYWIIVLSADRIIETGEEFMKRLKAEVKKWNTAQKNAEIAKQLESHQSKGSYVA